MNTVGRCWDLRPAPQPKAAPCQLRMSSKHRPPAPAGKLSRWSSQHLCLAPVWEPQRQVDDRLQRWGSIGLGCLLRGWAGVYSGALLGRPPRSAYQLLHPLWWQLLAMLGT